MNIYQILTSKPHSIHYLNRYYKFIIACRDHSVNKHATKETYTELHHICPKSIDLFPEYRSLKSFPDNGIYLTARQHFISHYLLYKAYGGRQTYAFNAMCNQVRNKNHKRNYKVNARMYEKLKTAMSNISHPNRGTAVYRDKSGNNIRVSKIDPRVLSGELVGCNKGKPGTMTGKKHTPEAISKMENLVRTPEHCKNISKSKKGTTQSVSANLARSVALQGRIPWNKGKPATEDHKRNNALAQTGSKKPRRAIKTCNVNDTIFSNHLATTENSIATCDS